MLREPIRNIEPGTQVTLTVLGCKGGTTVGGVVSEMHGREMRLRTTQPISPEAAVRMDLDGESSKALVLGEVVYCAGQGHEYLIGLKLRISLADLAGVDQLMRRIFGGQPRGAAECVAPVHVRDALS